MNLISQEQVQLIFIKSYQILRTRKIDEKYQGWDNAIFSGPEVTESTVIFFTPRPSGFGRSLFHFSVSSSIFLFFDSFLPIFQSLPGIFKIVSKNVYKVQFPLVSACVSEE